MKKNLTNLIRSIQKYLSPGLKLSICCMALAMLQAPARAQSTPSGTQKISGKIVSSAGGPLVGVTVREKSTTNATTTDTEGNFTLSISGSNPIEVSYVGYKTQELAVSGKTDFQVTLATAENTMNDVVVVGYSSQKKASITGAVSTVDMNGLTKTRIVDVAQALQGQVAGVFVAANTGAPGDGIKLRIRGEGTLGNNDVLYVVDGVPTRDISFLNMSDVKSMTVLKDAAAGAVYGSRAAGGVVLITTNTGQKGKMNVSGEYYNGFLTATNLPKMLTTDQYLTVKDMAWHNTIPSSGPVRLPTDVSPYQAIRSNTSLANTNWQKELFNTGIARNAQVSASGGTDKLQYLISAGYYGQDGIVVENHDQYQRFNFRANINANVTDRLTVGTNLQISYAKQDKLSSSGDAPGVIRHALIRPPLLGVYKDPSDPTYTAANPYTDLPFYLNNNSNGGWSKDFEFSSNPIAIVHFTDDKRNTYQTFGNVYGEYSFLRDKSLKFRSNVGVDISFLHNKNFASNFGDDNDNDPAELYPGQGRNNRPNNLDENYGQAMTFTFSNTLNYVKTIASKHNINLLLGTEYITSRTTGIGGSRQNFDNTTNPFRYLDYGSTSTNMRSGGSASNWNLASFFASGTYGYMNRYFATATVRADGSTRFGPNNKWGYFPSVSAGWIVSQEKFMDNVNWISNLKLRASWGQSGNQEIPDNAYEALYTQVGGVVKMVRIANPDIKWETTTQTNVGADVSVLKNKVTFSADYFVKKTTDILLQVGLPGIIGQFQPSYLNSGAVSNKGFEFGVHYQNNDHAFRYGINGNIATLTNRVDNLQTYVKSIINDATHTLTEVGQPISSYYGLVFDGIYQNAGEITKTLYSYAGSTQPGDIKFKDLNGDGQINADDRAIIGNPIPKLTYGFSFTSEFKNFDFSFLFQGVNGVDRYNDLAQILNYDSRPFNSMVSVLNSWHGEGTSNTIPRLTFNNNGGGNVSSVFIEDASYLRLKNIELGYTFNTRRTGIKSLRLYVSGQNLLTSTNYTGLDPESTSLIDKGTYPQSKSFIVGAKINL